MIYSLTYVVNVTTAYCLTRCMQRFYWVQCGVGVFTIIELKQFQTINSGKYYFAKEKEQIKVQQITSTENRMFKTLYDISPFFLPFLQSQLITNIVDVSFVYLQTGFQLQYKQVLISVQAVSNNCFHCTRNAGFERYINFSWCIFCKYSALIYA